MTRITEQPQAGKRSYPPRVSQFTQPFWTALRQGEWTTTCCQKCGKQSFPPKSVCPACWSTDLKWVDFCATGKLYSWTRIHSAPSSFQHEVPYAVCIVDLDVGVRIACRMVDTQQMPYKLGSEVEIICLQYEDGPMFAARVLNPNT